MDKEKIQPETPNKRSKYSFDSRWLLIMVIAISVVVTTVMLNKSSDKDDTGFVASTMDVDNGDQKINWNKYQSRTIELSDSITITESGTYHLTGSIEDGLILVNAGNGVVKLVLDNVSITNTSGPAISCLAADDLVIELVGTSRLTDGETYSAEYDEDVTGAIYSKADLSFEGDGELTVIANYADGIVGKDDVKFNSGNYTIKAEDDGIRGKDSIYIVSGKFKIDATADGIKSTNETDQGKGFVMIEGGSFNITTLAKGIKATNNVLISGGDYSINSKDDAIHSNNYIGISDGKINISSSDDGIHADRSLVIDGGTVTIALAYEGLEAQSVTINDGVVSLTTSDDGINAGGGADSSANNRPGAGAFDADENCIIAINGGKVYVNSSGDGIDSNGWVYFNGGEVVVDGPTNNGNGALDSGMGIVMNGGKVIAIGSSGMAETLGNNSSVYNISINLSQVYKAGTVIEIRDSDEKTVFTHTAAKTFSNITAGSTDFKLGSQYSIYLNEELYGMITLSNITTTNGAANHNDNRATMNPGQRK